MESEIGVFLSILAEVYRASPNIIAAYRGDLTAFSRFLGDPRKAFDAAL
jgi:hypothetical protein